MLKKITTAMEIVPLVHVVVIDWQHKAEDHFFPFLLFPEAAPVVPVVSDAFIGGR